MKIIHIFASDLSSVSEGGIATYIREIIKNRNKATEMSLIGVTKDSKGVKIWHKKSLANRDFLFFPLFLTRDAHHAYKSGVPLNAKFLFYLFLNKNRMKLNQCSLHIHRTELVLPFLIPRKKLPIILTIHGAGKFLSVAKKHPLFSKKWFRRIYNAVEKFVVKKVDQIILVSQEGFKYYSSKFPGEKDKFILIPTFVDIALFKPLNKEELRAKYFFRLNEKIILFAGRFEEQKGLPLLLDTFRNLNLEISNAKLILAGDGKDKEVLKSEVKRLGIDNNVVFMGMVDHDKLPEIINCADVFVLTSSWEGMPIAVLEALACGIPVVATNVGQISKMIKDGVNGFIINNRDSEIVKEKIIQAIYMKDEMKERCIESVRNFSSATIVTKIENIHRKIQQKYYRSANKL